MSAAQYNLALAFSMGQGVDLSEEKMIHWFERAAELGNTAAQIRLGFLNLGEDGRKVQIETAKVYFRLAAESGSTVAVEQLKLLARHAELLRHLLVEVHARRVGARPRRGAPLFSAGARRPAWESTGCAARRRAPIPPTMPDPTARVLRGPFSLSVPLPAGCPSNFRFLHEPVSMDRRLMWAGGCVCLRGGRGTVPCSMLRV